MLKSSGLSSLVTYILRRTKLSLKVADMPDACSPLLSLDNSFTQNPALPDEHVYCTSFVIAEE